MNDWKEQLRIIKRALTEREQLHSKIDTYRQRERDISSAKAQSGTDLSQRGQRGTRIPQVKEKVPSITRLSPTMSGPRQQEKLSFPLPPKPKGGDRILNIGIDFGTSTTKVCIRESLGEMEDVKTFPINLDDSNPGMGQLLYPSLVAIDSGRLYFGTEAQRRDSSRAVALPYLKVCLACEAEGGGDPLGTCRGMRAQGTDRCTGIFPYSLKGEPSPFKASEAVVLFLAWVMGHARRRVPEALLGRSSVGFTYNLGVPVDQFDPTSPLRNAYQKVAYFAWLLSDGVTQGIPLSQALNWLSQIKNLEPPPSEKSMVHLCPETGASIASCVLSPETPSGLYGLIDIGAWTTDISFFDLSQGTAVGVPTIAFYSARTHRIAVNDIDERTFRSIFDLWDLGEAPRDFGSTGVFSAIMLRQQREQGDFGKVEFLIENFKRKPSLATLQFARDCVAERVLHRIRKTLVEASNKDKRESKWKGFRIYVIGGGLQERTLWERVSEEIPVVGKIGPLPLPRSLQGLPKDLYSRFSVAYGLAFPLALWPTNISPSDTTAAAPPAKRPFRESADLGYDEK